MSIISHDPLADRIRIRRFHRSKRIRLSIDEQGVLITAPQRSSSAEIEDFFMKHRDWVEQQLSMMDEKMSVFGLRWEGEQPFFLVEGIWMPIEERDDAVDWVHIYKTDECIQILYPKLLRNRGKLLLRLQEWSGERTLWKAEQIIEASGTDIKIKPNKLRISSAKSKWGSCTSKGVVSLHYRLFQLSPLALKYVVFHELAHLIHMNHRSLFWEEVRRLMPNYKEGNTKLFQKDFPTLSKGAS